MSQPSQPNQPNQPKQLDQPKQPAGFHQLEQHDVEDHDRGLGFDLSTLMQRRNVLKMFAGAGAVAVLAACGSSNSTSIAGTSASPAAISTNAAVTPASTSASTASVSASAAASATAATAAASAAVSAGAAPLEAIPEETAGPYPGDGSNGVDVLSESGIVRSDIRASFGSSTTVAKGVNMTLRLTIVDAATGVALPGAAVYVWHCDIDGQYSLYTGSAKKENYLRGVQAADAAGAVTFTSIYPACYSGRWPHIHYEVYPTTTDATSASNKLATSQLAMPKAVNDLVFASTGYSQSVTNAKRVSLASDMVFGDDGGVRELPTVTGSVADGYVVSMTVPVNT